MRTCRIVDFAVQADYGLMLKESKKKYKHLDLPWELKKKTWNMKVTDTNCKRIDAGNGELRKSGRSGDNPNYSINISQNNEESPGD